MDPSLRNREASTGFRTVAPCAPALLPVLQKERQREIQNSREKIDYPNTKLKLLLNSPFFNLSSIVLFTGLFIYLFISLCTRT